MKYLIEIGQELIKDINGVQKLNSLEFEEHLMYLTDCFNSNDIVMMTNYCNEVVDKYDTFSKNSVYKQFDDETYIIKLVNLSNRFLFDIDVYAIKDDYYLVRMGCFNISDYGLYICDQIDSIFNLFNFYFKIFDIK